MATSTAGDVGRVHAFSLKALERVQQYGLPPTPRVYQVLYAYVSESHRALCLDLDACLFRADTLTEADIDEIYDRHFGAEHLTQSVDEVGTRISDELQQVMAMMDAARGTADAYTEALIDIAERTGENIDRDQFRLVLDALMRSTREMQSANSELENRLKASVKQMATLQNNLEAIRVESLTDPLTLLANRKSLETAMDKLFRENRMFSLLVTDIDHFKSFNDRYGHLTGDRVLRLVAGTLKQSVKGRDTAARYGGEEFVILLPGTGLRSAMSVAEGIRQSVMNKELVKRSTGENLGCVTLSIGVATRREDDTAESLIGRADACLYAAKRSGRNRVVGETDPEMAKVA